MWGDAKMTDATTSAAPAPKPGTGPSDEARTSLESVLVDLGDGHAVMFSLTELGLDEPEGSHGE